VLIDHAAEGDLVKTRKPASAAALIDAFVDEYRAPIANITSPQKSPCSRRMVDDNFLCAAASAGMVQAGIFISRLHEMEKVYGPIKTSAGAAKQLPMCWALASCQTISKNIRRRRTAKICWLRQLRSWSTRYHSSKRLHLPNWKIDKKPRTE
jgi:hypothetical protein